jgi:hypothetical protein
MNVHTDNLADRKLIQQKPEYRCSSCGEFFPTTSLMKSLTAIRRTGND